MEVIEGNVSVSNTEYIVEAIVSGLIFVTFRRNWNYAF